MKSLFNPVRTFAVLGVTALSLTACGGEDGNSASGLTFSTPPFTGSAALTTAGRQVSTALEETLPSFDVTANTFRFTARAFGIAGPLTFVNAASSAIPPTGANVIVLQDTDDDSNPATPFGAGNAASVIAAKVTTDGPGFFIYHNSTLNVNRLVFSTNLNDPTADLSVLARIASPTGQASIDALPTFRAGNFAVDGSVFAFSTPAFQGSTAPATPGRQVFTGLETLLTGFDTNLDNFALTASAFGLVDPLSFVNASSSGIPSSGVNLIVLQDTDDDGNPATPFGAGNAASVIATKIGVDGPGFFIYHNSTLNVNRLVFSANLHDPTADLSVLARITSPTGQDAINALPNFTAANFSLR